MNETIGLGVTALAIMIAAPVVKLCAVGVVAVAVPEDTTIAVLVILSVKKSVWRGRMAFN